MHGIDIPRQQRLKDTIRGFKNLCFGTIYLYGLLRVRKRDRLLRRLLSRLLLCSIISLSQRSSKSVDRLVHVSLSHRSRSVLEQSSDWPAGSKESLDPRVPINTKKLRSCHYICAALPSSSVVSSSTHHTPDTVPRVMTRTRALEGGSLRGLSLVLSPSRTLMRPHHRRAECPARGGRSG